MYAQDGLSDVVRVFHSVCDIIKFTENSANDANNCKKESKMCLRLSFEFMGNSGTWNKLCTKKTMK